MGADLKVVDDGAQPQAITPEMIAAALARFKAGNETPLEHYDPELGGVFRFRRLTGQEARDCGKLARVGVGTPQERVDQDKMVFTVINKASVEPKVTAALWAQLLQLGPLVTGRLQEAVFVANGLGEDPTEAAGKPSIATPS